MVQEINYTLPAEILFLDGASADDKDGFFRQDQVHLEQEALVAVIAGLDPAVADPVVFKGLCLVQGEQLVSAENLFGRMVFTLSLDRVRIVQVGLVPEDIAACRVRRPTAKGIDRFPGRHDRQAGKKLGAFSSFTV